MKANGEVARHFNTILRFQTRIYGGFQDFETFPVDFHTKCSKLKGSFIAKNEDFSTQLRDFKSAEKFFIASKMITIVLRMLPDIMVVRGNKRGGRKTSQSNFKIANMCQWLFLVFHIRSKALY